MGNIIQNIIKLNSIQRTTIQELQNEDGQYFKSVVLPLKQQKWVLPTIEQNNYTSVENLRKMFPSSQYLRDDDGCMMTSEGHTVYSYQSRETGLTTYVSSHKTKKGTTVVEIEYSKSFDDPNKIYAKYENGKLIKTEKGPNSKTLCYYIE